MCLKKWCQTKSVCKIQNEICSYYIQGLNCEFCKQRFPIILSYNGKSIDIIRINKPKIEPYLILESTGESLITGVHVCTIKNNEDITLVI